MAEGFTGPGTDTSPASTYKASGTRGFVYDGSTPPSNGQVPTFDSTAGAYKPAAPSGGGAGAVLPDIFFGDQGLVLSDTDWHYFPLTVADALYAVGDWTNNEHGDLLVPVSGWYVAEFFWHGEVQDVHPQLLTIDLGSATGTDVNISTRGGAVPASGAGWGFAEVAGVLVGFNHVLAGQNIGQLELNQSQAAAAGAAVGQTGAAVRIRCGHADA